MNILDAGIAPSSIIDFIKLLKLTWENSSDKSVFLHQRLDSFLENRK